MFSRSLNVGMTMDSPSAGSSDFKPRLPDAPTSRYNYPGSNYAFWEIGRPFVAPMDQSNPRSESAVLRLTLFDVERSQARDVPLRFAEVNGRPHVLYSAESPPEWVSQATESALVHWSVGHRRYVGTARAVKDPAEMHTRVRPVFEAKYGRDQLSRWFGTDVGCVELLESRDGFPYYRGVEALFDKSAPKYDAAVRSNPFDQYLRTVALEILQRRFVPGDLVLELGCGTGLETIPLAEAGVEVVALDISGGMLRELNRKAQAASVDNRVETRQGAIRDLSRILSDFGPGSFDGAFSHFGALNCELHLNSVPEALYRLVKPHGLLSLGIWNRTCLSEEVLFGITFRPRRAFARFQSSVPVGSSRFGVPVFPYSPGEIKRLFAPFFSLEGAVGASVLMPPYNLGRRIVPHPSLVRLLEAGDRLVRRRRFFRYLGDHFIVDFRRR